MKAIKIIFSATVILLFVACRDDNKIKPNIIDGKLKSIAIQYHDESIMDGTYYFHYDDIGWLSTITTDRGRIYAGIEKIANDKVKMYYDWGALDTTQNVSQKYRQIAYLNSQGKVYKIVQTDSLNNEIKLLTNIYTTGGNIDSTILFEPVDLIRDILFDDFVKVNENVVSYYQSFETTFDFVNWVKVVYHDNLAYSVIENDLTMPMQNFYLHRFYPLNIEPSLDPYYLLGLNGIKACNENKNLIIKSSNTYGNIYFNYSQNTANNITNMEIIYDDGDEFNYTFEYY